MEQRKIIKINGFPSPKKYKSLKYSKFEEAWEKNGKTYTIGSLDNLVKTKGIEFILPDEIKSELKSYQRLCEEKKRNYEKSLEGKIK